MAMKMIVMKCLLYGLLPSQAGIQCRTHDIVRSLLARPNFETAHALVQQHVSAVGQVAAIGGRNVFELVRSVDHVHDVQARILKLFRDRDGIVRMQTDAGRLNEHVDAIQLLQDCLRVADAENGYGAVRVNLG
jgi:hypothetical protein